MIIQLSGVLPHRVYKSAESLLSVGCLPRCHEFLHRVNPALADNDVAIQYMPSLGYLSAEAFEALGSTEVQVVGFSVFDSNFRKERGIILQIITYVSIRLC